MLRPLRKVVRRLEARTTAVASVSAVTALLIVSNFIPQRDNFPPGEFERLLSGGGWVAWAHALGLTDMYRSAPMLGAFTLLLVNMFLSFATRLEHTRREIAVQARPATPQTLASSPIYRAVAVDTAAGPVLDRFAAFLRARGYQTHQRNGSLRAVRHRFSVLGSSLFHLSFLALLIALGLRALSGFHGAILLGEGETFDGAPPRYMSTEPRHMPPDRYPDVHFTLKEIRPRYSAQNTVTDVVAVVVIDGSEQAVRVNYPMVFGSTIVRLVTYGYAPVFIVRETDKRIEHAQAVNLMVSPPGRIDRFALPTLPVTFTTQFYPTYYEMGGLAVNRSMDLENPAAILKWSEGGEAHELLLFKGTTRQVGRLEFQMPAVYYWARFDATRDAGRKPMYVSFVLAIAGLAWRMLLPRRRIDAVVDSSAPAGPTLHVAGTPDYTREPFASELNRMLDAFAQGFAPGR